MRVDGKNSGCYKSAVHIHSWLTRAFASLICFVHLLRRSSLTAANLGVFWSITGYALGMVWVWCGYDVGMMWVCSGYALGLVWVWCESGVGMVWVSNEVPSLGGGTPPIHPSGLTCC
jgi:hypothetical protein